MVGLGENLVCMLGVNRAKNHENFERGMSSLVMVLSGQLLRLLVAVNALHSWRTEYDRPMVKEEKLEIMFAAAKQCHQATSLNNYSSFTLDKRYGRKRVVLVLTISNDLAHGLCCLNWRRMLRDIYTGTL